MTKRLVHTSDDLPRDHWIAQQLPAGTSLRAFAEDEAISVLTRAAQEAIEVAGLTRTEVAGILGTTKSYISQVLNGSANMTLRTFGALLWAAGRQVQRVKTAEVGADVEAQPQTFAFFRTCSAPTRSLTITPDATALAMIMHYNSVPRLTLTCVE